MQKLMLKLTLPLTIFLSGCDDFPVIEPKERCTIVLMDTIEESYCRCTLYGWSREEIGPIGDSSNYPINKCNKFTGYSPEDYTDIYLWQDSVRLWLIRQEKKRKK